MLKIVAFDLGGVLAYQDDSRLNNHEKFLLKFYLDKQYSKLKLQKEKQELVLETELKIDDIYSKLYALAPGSLDCLEFIKQSGYQASLWTNNRNAIKKWLINSGITHYIPQKYICNSCNMSNGTNKPDTKFYISALNQIQGLPYQVLFVDDDSKNIEGAKKIGIPSLLYQSTATNLKESVKAKIKVLERSSL